MFLFSERAEEREKICSCLTVSYEFVAQKGSDFPINKNKIYP